MTSQTSEPTAPNEEQRGASLLTLPEVATELRVSIATLRTWRSRSIGPKFFRVGGRVVLRRSTLDAWLAQQEAEAAE